MLVEIKKINKEDLITCTSLDVAETFGKEHYHVMEDIRKILSSITTPEMMGLFSESYYVASNGKKNTMYYMTKDGFTLLVMGYTSEKAMQFKLAYIRQFNAMEKVLISKIKEREKGIAVRQVLTDALQQSQENERMHGHAYSNYTNVIYRAVFNKDAKQLREEYGIEKKDDLRDCLTIEEIRAVQSVEMMVSGLINCGWGYEEIRNFIEEQSIRFSTTSL